LTTFADPLDLFRAAVSALNREDWRGVAALCDPASLSAFRRRMIEQLAPSRPIRTITVEEYMRHSPDMPREVAEYSVAQIQKHADPERRLKDELPGVASVAELRSLDPITVFAKWLEGRSVRRQIERLVAEGRASRAAAAAAIARFAEGAQYPYVALGAVPDGDRVVHIVYRHDVGRQESPSPDARRWLESLPPEEQELVRDIDVSGPPWIAACRRQPDATWRLVADHGFLGVGSTHIWRLDEPQDRKDGPPADNESAD
jgi:hypothetical protein